MEVDFLIDSVSGTNCVKTAELLLAQTKSQKSFVCFICNKEFACKTSLNNHSATHLVKNIFTCETCGDSFSTTDGYEEHRSLQHTRNICFTCNETFSNPIEFKAHQELHQSLLSDIYVYNICDKPISNETETQAHHKHHFRKGFHCKECDKYFSSKSLLIAHIEAHFGPDSFKCKICNKGYLEKVDLQRHYQIHVNVKPFDCNLCGRTFTTPKKLIKHIMDFGGLSPYVCLVCDRHFRSKQLLKRHSLNHLPEHHTVCEVCGEGFLNRQKLFCHLVQHKTYKYDCDKCDLSFKSRNQLKQHMQLHNGLKPYVCEICNAEFFANFLLKNHLWKKHHYGDDERVSSNRKSSHDLEHACLKCGPKAFKMQPKRAF